MDDLREPAQAPTVACPSCQRTLTLDAGSTDTVCTCGFTAATSFLVEADYLRRGIPQWQQRLNELDRMIASGERPTAVAPVSHGPAAYQIILAVGGFLIVAGIAAFSAIIESAWALPIQAALILGTGWVTIRLRERMSATSSAMALATAGAWWFMLFWISMAFSDGDGGPSTCGSPQPQPALLQQCCSSQEYPRACVCGPFSARSLHH